MTDPAAPTTPEDARDSEWELQQALEGQNLYHGRWSTTPVGRTTAMAVRWALLQHGYDVLPLAHSTPAEALDPSEIRDIDMALRYALLDHDIGCRAIGMEDNCTCPARGYADRARAIVKRIGAPYRLPSGDYDPARLRSPESDR